MRFITLAALALFATGSFADTPLAEGVIRKIDAQKGTVTIAHGPLPNGMPAMTMPFHPKEAQWLKQMQEGQKIRFAVREESGGKLVIDRYEPAR